MNLSKENQAFIEKYHIGRKMIALSEGTTWYVTGVSLDMDNQLWVTAHSPELNNQPKTDEVEFRVEWFEKNMSLADSVGERFWSTLKKETHA